MTTYQISCTVGTTDTTAGLGLEIWLDNDQLYNCDDVDFESAPLTFKLEEDDAEHELRFVMKNKKPEHTVIAEDGSIVKDANLKINNLTFNEIELKQIFVDNSVYIHDFNGTGKQTQEHFYGIMGCNGTTSLKFNTPIYLWLLEVM